MNSEFLARNCAQPGLDTNGQPPSSPTPKTHATVEPRGELRPCRAQGWVYNVGGRFKGFRRDFELEACRGVDLFSQLLGRLIRASERAPLLPG
jgi:hypothetical protein